MSDNHTVRSMTNFEYNNDDFLYVKAFQREKIECPTIRSNTYQGTDRKRYHNELCVNERLASIWQSLHHKHSGSTKRMTDSSQKNTFDLLNMINYIVSFPLFLLYIKNIIV
jgi:hypothetical protein